MFRGRVLLGLAALAVAAMGGCGKLTDPSRDRAPARREPYPLFSGIAAAAYDPDALTVRLDWEAARPSDPDRLPIAYRIYEADRAGGEDFRAPTFVTAGLWMSFPPPASAVTLWFVVRAADSAGAEDPNDVELSVEVLRDTVPPTFAGVVTAIALTSSSVVVSWQPATDDRTAPGAITYVVYRSLGGGPVDFTRPWQLVAAGQTSFIDPGLAPLEESCYGVRAVDASGNEDANTVVRCAWALRDTVPPQFSGAAATGACDSGPITLSWSPAIDNLDPASKITYAVFRATEPGGEDFSTPWAVTPPGATGAVDATALPDTAYYYVVRAVDSFGNESLNTDEVQASVDTLPPLFAGLEGAIGIDASILSYWKGATDAGSPTGSIQYQIFRAPTNGAEDFSTPLAAVSGGTTYYLDPNLPRNAYECYVARAKDRCGHVDSNSVEFCSLSVIDVTPPTFGGLVTAEGNCSGPVRLVWQAAGDNLDPPEDLTYLVYRSLTPGGEDFSAPLAAVSPRSATCWVTWPGGATAPCYYDLTAPANRTVYYIVRAEDTSGNVDGNTWERYMMIDTQTPTFAGIQFLTTVALNIPDLLVVWSNASDNMPDPYKSISYAVYRATAPGGEVYTQPLALTAPWATNFQDGSVQVSKYYCYVVRAIDQCGNEETNTKEICSATNADTTPPVFPGVITGQVYPCDPSRGIQVALAWQPATDNVTPVDQISYSITRKIGVSQSQSGTPAGVTQFTDLQLPPDTSIEYDIYAVDQAGNFSTPATFLIQTPPDVMPPLFNVAGISPFDGLDVAQAVGRDIFLSWQQAVDCESRDLVYYAVYRSTEPGKEDFSAPVAIIQGWTVDFLGGIHPCCQTYEDRGLVPYQPYYYVVRALDPAGNYETNAVERMAVVLPHWRYVSPPPVSSGWSLDGVSSPLESIAWAVGVDASPGPLQEVGVLFRLVDGAWTPEAEPSLPPGHGYASVSFPTPDTGWAAGWDESGGAASVRGLLVERSAGGWSVVATPSVSSNWLLADVRVPDGSSGWAVGSDRAGGTGVLLGYDGSNWSVAPTPAVGTSWDLRRVGISPTGEAWAVGVSASGGTTQGVFLHHVPAGGWAVAATPSVGSANWTVGGVAYDPLRGAWWASGEDAAGGVSLLLTNTGGGWAVATTTADAQYDDLSIDANGNGWTVGGMGSQGALLQYWNASWQAGGLSPQGSSWILSSIDASRPLQVWAAGSDILASQGVLLLYALDDEWFSPTPPSVSSDWELRSVAYLPGLNEWWAAGVDHVAHRGVLLGNRHGVWSAFDTTALAPPGDDWELKGVGGEYGTAMAVGVDHTRLRPVLLYYNGSGWTASAPPAGPGPDWELVSVQPDLGSYASPVSYWAVGADHASRRPVLVSCQGGVCALGSLPDPGVPSSLSTVTFTDFLGDEGFAGGAFDAPPTGQQGLLYYSRSATWSREPTLPVTGSYVIRSVNARLAAAAQAAVEGIVGPGESQGVMFKEFFDPLGGRHWGGVPVASPPLNWAPRCIAFYPNFLGSYLPNFTAGVDQTGGPDARRGLLLRSGSDAVGNDQWTVEPLPGFGLTDWDLAGVDAFPSMLPDWSVPVWAVGTEQTSGGRHGVLLELSH